MKYRVSTGKEKKFYQCQVPSPNSLGVNVKQIFGGNGQVRAIPCQRSEKKGQCPKVDFLLRNVKDNRAN